MDGVSIYLDMGEQKNMKTIVLIDPFWGGHHPTFFKLFAKTLLELGHDVISLCPEPEEMNQWIASHCAELATYFHSFELHEPATSPIPIRRLQLRAMAIARWQLAARSIREISLKLGKVPDLTFFAWLDSYLGPHLTPAVIDHIFPYVWSGIYFAPSFLRLGLKYEPIRRGFLNPLVLLNSSQCLAVAVQDEGIAEKLNQKIAKPVIAFPETTDESLPDMKYEVVFKINAKAAGRKIVGLLGALDKRKGFLTLLEASQKVTNHWFFVFVGGLSEQSFTNIELAKIQEIVKSNPDNCFFHLTPVPDGPLYNAIVQSCDILYIVYENYFHSPNTLTKAAVFQKPVIAGKNHCTGERVEKFNLGYMIEEGSVAQCVNILEQLHEELSTGHLSIQPDFEGYRELHSIEQLKAAFKKVLEFV